MFSGGAHAYHARSPGLNPQQQHTRTYTHLGPNENKENKHCFTKDLAIKAYPIHGDTQGDEDAVRAPGFEPKSTQHLHPGVLGGREVTACRGSPGVIYSAYFRK